MFRSSDNPYRNRCSLRLVAIIGALIFLTGVLGLSKGEAAATPSFDVAKAPAWVRGVSPDSASPSEVDPGGISYLLVDQQENVEPRASYYHEAHLITSEHGVQNGADITVSFDPAFQKLVIHFIRIVRGGKILDRLDRSQIKLFQREREMESFLYDGSFTAQYQLEDVRVGDLVEYAYSIEGSNPVFNGKFSDTSPLEWNTPVHQLITRYRYPAARKLNFQVKSSSSTQPAITTRSGTTEWLWEQSSVPARRTDPHTPAGYQPYNTVQVSEFQSWRQVAEWALPLYQVDGPPSQDLEAEIAVLQKLKTADEQIRAALRFVQDEIRYLGIESGINAMHPTPPSEVLRRRFGDCKDKALLLATLLRGCGLKAIPALVSTDRRDQVAKRLPTPGSFNHVILQVENEGRSWWLDATRSAQRGDLAQIHTGNFGFALLLQPGTEDLVPCHPQPDSLPRRKVVERYRVPKVEGEARLDVTSEFHGLAAETARAQFHNHSPEDIQKEYLKFYASRFSHIRSAEAIEYAELPGENGCQIKEHYVIPDFWHANDSKSHYDFSVSASEIDDAMDVPDPTPRIDPLGLRQMHLTEEIQLEMFEDWKLTPSQSDVSNPAFHFFHESSLSGHNVRLAYSYDTLTDRIAPEDVPAHEAALRKQKTHLTYRFTYTPPAPALTQAANNVVANFQFNWPIAVLLGLVVSMTIPFAYRYYQTVRLMSPLPPSLTHPTLEGLRGWLVLVAIGLILRPLMFFKANVTLSKSLFHLETWDALTHIGTTAYHPLWMPVLLFEFIYNCLAFIFSILLLVLFFQKRAAWPKCFIAFFLFLLVGLTVDLSLGSQIPLVAKNLGESVKSMAQTIFAAAIWIPYSLTSKRVKATFRH